MQVFSLDNKIAANTDYQNFHLRFFIAATFDKRPRLMQHHVLLFTNFSFEELKKHHLFSTPQSVEHCHLHYFASIIYVGENNSLMNVFFSRIIRLSYQTWASQYWNRKCVSCKTACVFCLFSVSFSIITDWSPKLKKSSFTEDESPLHRLKSLNTYKMYANLHEYSPRSFILSSRQVLLNLVNCLKVSKCYFAFLTD